jgi:hypothetical protein
MGISAGSGFAAALLDNSKKNQFQDRSDGLAKEQASLQESVATLMAQVNANPAPPNAADLVKEIADKRGRIAAIQTERATIRNPMPKSLGFFRDILRDDQGVSFYRFQMAVWTLVLILMFCSSVYRDLVMPQFSSTLLGLMGISAGTYLGFKFPENTK